MAVLRAKFHRNRPSRFPSIHWRIQNQSIGGNMVRAKREYTNGGLGAEPHRDAGTEPLVREFPLQLNAVLHYHNLGSRPICR